MTKLTGETLNIEEENIKKIKELFPEVDTDGKIDFDKLKQLLGDYIEDADERYNFTWNGKGEALRISQTPSVGTLRPALEESKNWDETENLYIEGDNLEVLKILQKSYFNKIKMIYIDPPYNTGNDFVYEDDFQDNIKNYKEVTGQVDSEGKPTTTNKEHSGRFHTDWLNMMYPRLRLARNLLTDDGVIFISIDDHELNNLKRISDEIFGEDNFINNISVEMSSMSGPKVNNAILGKRHPKIKESLLIYSKNKSKYKLNIDKIPKEHWDKEYNSIIPNLKPTEYDEIFSLEKLEQINNRLKDKKLMTINEYEKTYEGKINEEWLYNNSYKIFSTKPNTALLNKAKKINFKQQISAITNPSGDIKLIRTDFNQNTRTARIELLRAKEAMEIYRGDIWLDMLTSGGIAQEGGVDFNNGKKPLKLIKTIIETANLNENDIVLDFFAGSSTTAHAVMDLNAEDNGNRKFIMVQLPEEIDKKSEAYKAGYKNIAEIGKERIRRAGNQIKDELAEKYESTSEENREEMKHPEDLDIGFKTFKLDSSNIKEWNPGQYDDVQMAIEDSLTPYVEGRTEEDVVYEMILKMGLDLTYPVEEYEVNGKTLYSVGYGFLMISLADEIDLAIAEKMIEIKDEYQPEEFRVIFKDEGFRSDTDKTNIKETLRSAGLAEEAFITL